MTGLGWFLAIVAAVAIVVAIVIGDQATKVRRELECYKKSFSELSGLLVNIEQKQLEFDKLQLKINRNNEELEDLEEKLNHQFQFYNKLCDDTSEARVQLAKTQTEDLTLQSGYEKKMQALEAAYKEKTIRLNQEFQDRIKELDERYSESAENYELEYARRKELLEEEYNALLRSVHEQQTILRIALEQNRQDHEDEGRHCLVIPEVDRREVAELFDVCGHIRNPLPLCKAIYDIYFKVPVANLINDLGVKGVTGIYKITDMTSGKMYIGQSVDLGERWRQHIKRGVGAEAGTISGSKLYSAMYSNKLWNFKFELLEETDKDNLNAREKYWIAYFNAVEYGYNMKG